MPDYNEASGLESPWDAPEQMPSYFGKIYDKPYIGDERRGAEAEDIRRACRMEQVGSWLCLGLMGALRLGIVLLVKGL